MAHGRGESLGRLFRLVLPLAAVGLCIVGLSWEWDRRTRQGFPLGADQTTAVKPAAASPVQAPLAPRVQVEVYFSPNGGATDAIVRALGRAKERARVQAYSFTYARRWDSPS